MDRKDFQYVEMDTDSAYMALSGPLESIVKPEKRTEFFEEYGSWFPKPFCDRHKKDFVRCKVQEARGGPQWTPSACCLRVERFDRRTPGLFKVEFQGDGMVALNSKTYFCWNHDSEERFKCSCKGLSKSTNSLRVDQYKRVLMEGVTESGVNKTFTLRNNKMYTTHTLRAGLTPAYVKRVVGDDWVSTSNLDVNG